MWSRHPRRHHAIVLLLYTLLGLLLTLPLALRFTTHVPGDGIDDPALAWNLWWVKTSLVDRLTNPFAGQSMFYPIGINLAFYTLTVLNGLLSVPLQTALGLITASNLLLLSSFVLGGYGAYLLALQVMATDAGQGPSDQGLPASTATLVLRQSAFLAGLLYAFSSSKLFYAALGQFNIASSQWVPFAVLYVWRSVQPRARGREPLLAALFLVLQAYAELTYATFLVVFVLLAAGYRLLQMTKSAPLANDLVPLLRNLAIIALVVAAGLAPMLANMLPDMRSEGDFLVEGGGFADLFSADLAGYALPTQLHPVFGAVVRTAAANSQLRPDGSQWQVNKGQHITLGYLGLALAVIGLWRGRRRPGVWFWAAAALVFFLLTLGPTLRIAGHATGLPGPFRLLQELPFFKGNRYPSRWSVMLLVAVAPLVALGAQALLSKAAQWRSGTGWPVWSLAALLTAGVLFENLSAPLPLSEMHTPAIYEVIAADPAAGAVFDLPLGWRNGFSVFGKQDLIIMAEQWWQTVHGRPILGGNTSRNPEQKFRYFLEAPLIGPLTILANADVEHPHVAAAMAAGLAALRSGDPALGDNPLLQQAAADAPAALQALDVGYVVVHSAHVPPEFIRFVEDYLPVQRVAVDGQHILYRVDRPAPPAEVTVRPAVDALSRGEGWSGSADANALPAGAGDDGLWAQRRSTRLLLPPVAPGAHRLTIRAKAAGPEQTLALEVNGYRTAAQPVPETWTELVYELPEEILVAAPNDFRLKFGNTYPLAEAEDGQPGVLVESAGLEAGNYGHIWLSGRDVSPGGRGYNLALIDASNFTLRAAAAFDTHADPTASQALVDFLQQVDDQTILAVAVKDTASDQLSAEAAQALARLGLTDLRGCFRCSQAALVIPSTPERPDGQVIERVDPVQAVSVGMGPGWREPQVAAAVDWVRVEPAAQRHPSSRS